VRELSYASRCKKLEYLPLAQILLVPNLTFKIHLQMQTIMSIIKVTWFQRKQGVTLTKAVCKTLAVGNIIKIMTKELIRSYNK
jgi:hypothetical protein